ncbi:MAG TPA: hypothetical protein VI583_11585, partial [Cyclobacteriaceae bacterium]|nr:hypothetical protein [Cyclobacteriaceae bacterium]
FQQTNTVGGLIGSGTGGVTEALKRRVILPLSATSAQTSHVLGHELVHAFQYHMLVSKNMSGLNTMNNIPLWMIEGLAEYMSLGNKDANTAMWMRSAVLRRDIPDVKGLNKMYKYFPYRYGHAFWAFVGGMWGDTTIIPLFAKTARLGYDRALKDVTGVDSKTFSNMWKSALEQHYLNLGRDSVEKPVGHLLIHGKDNEEKYLAPALSPNGKQIAFISDRDIFTSDVYLADAETGKVERKLYSIVSNSHVDDLNYIESGITWSPHNERLALAITSRGKNKLAVIDVAGRVKVKEIEIPGLTSFSFPSWSPDGDFIAVSGQSDGQTDLYIYHLNKNNLLRLTRDGYSEIQPSWSPDGKYIIFSTDLPVNMDKPGNTGFNIAYINMETGGIKVLDVFQGAKNLNPLFGPDGNSIYFLSDRDGFRDLYRYDINKEMVFQLTEFFTGISGITPYSPAVSLSAGSGKIAYSLFTGRSYKLYSARTEEFPMKKISKDELDTRAAILPVFTGNSLAIVDNNLAAGMDDLKLPLDSLKEKPYAPRFQLDYVSNSGGVGISTGAYGSQAGLNGGANLLFSDMLGNNYLFTGLALNGEIYDFAGMASYLNQGHRLGWGVTGWHIPYRYSTLGYEYVPGIVNDDTVILDKFILKNYRLFEENFSLFGVYPFSQTTRFELGGSYMHYSYRVDEERYYFLQGLLLDYERDKLDAPEGYSLQTLNAAFIKDNSFFGLTSPTQGFRYRIGMNKYFGKLDLYTFLFDFRKYYFIKPYTFAFRLIHFSRIGKDSENEMLAPLSFAYPFLTRGNQYVPSTQDSTSGFNINQLYGSRLAVANL